MSTTDREAGICSFAAIGNALGSRFTRDELSAGRCVVVLRTGGSNVRALSDFYVTEREKDRECCREASHCAGCSALSISSSCSRPKHFPIQAC